MKKTTLLAGLIACIFFMSCKKDSSSNSNSNGSHTITYQVDCSSNINYLIVQATTMHTWDSTIYYKNSQEHIALTYNINLPYLADLSIIGSDSTQIPGIPQTQPYTCSLKLLLDNKVIDSINSGNVYGSFVDLQLQYDIKAN